MELLRKTVRVCPPPLNNSRYQAWKRRVQRYRVAMPTVKILYRAVEQWPARKAHNLEVVGSNPASATNLKLNIMPNMSYCRFENTAKDMRDCINAIEDRDVYNFGDYELRGFKDVLEYAQEIVRMEPEIEKIIEYYED
jgi:hypothetical protein